MAFVPLYKPVHGIGIYDSHDFQPGTIQSQWNWVHYDRSGIQRRWMLEATYGGDYVGGVPASGVEIDYDDLYAALNENTETVLFAMNFSEDDDLSPLLVVKATRGAERSWWPAGGCTVFHITTYLYKRVYTDATTYTDTLLGYADCDAFKPNTQNISASHIHLEFFRYNNTWMVGVSNFAFGGSNLYSSYCLWNPEEADFVTNMGDGEPTPSDPTDPDYGPASGPGGYGPGSGGPGPTFDGTSDPWIPTPTKPGVIAFGLLNIYKCDYSSLNNLGAALFPEITWPPTTGITDFVEWLGRVIMAFSDSVWNKDLIQYIVSVHLIPTEVFTSGTTPALEDIKIGPRTMVGILGRKLTDDVIEFDCGTVHIDEFYTNYVDYNLTSCKLYLPYYGFVDIEPEFWQSADISVKYLWNVLDGSFVAQVFSTVTRHQSPCTMLIGQYSGSACVHMPLSGANYASMFAQITGGMAGAAVAASTGNVALAATSAMAVSNRVAPMSGSNSYNASASYYSHSRPYLMIERPISHFSENYVVENGLPLVAKKRIGTCLGFTTAEDAILDGIPCTMEEKRRIRDYLKLGIIIKSH